MTAAPHRFAQFGLHCQSLEDVAVALLSQQIWCWGRDILHPQGNWLTKVGFKRTEPPAGLGDCPSVYTFEMPGGRAIVLRGFGVLYADPQTGCVFIPRYNFEPFLLPYKTVQGPMWTVHHLPKMKAPRRSKRQACNAMVIDLIDWLGRYESDIAERLGPGYRQSTLEDWDDGKKPVIKAEDFAPAWRTLLAEMKAR